ncbi:hypothetical protein [Trichoplusia ni single nucleopolyhedrovirus]|uniref:Uncharacterized protein n=1 Tax=Trichoplusia ni single nucleopolyhedrovirus TaxID=332054 RepID=Q461Z8_9ABAC|nr:hypothetical protein TNSV_gp067 [Trichoplusia ni single nucleopolyhedrovirus]AAZ67438.1 hypothetical protein [Trichoplusia ni single nucleopolyhedrovirus]QBI90293.1 hypothetical protein [Trichoplusia ni single nucleopolyhedrovirus]
MLIFYNCNIIINSGNIKFRFAQHVHDDNLIVTFGGPSTLSNNKNVYIFICGISTFLYLYVNGTSTYSITR